MTNITIQTTAEDHKIAKLTALAIALHLFESAFPSPLPGVKPGIANIITLYVLYKFGIKTAIWVSLLRVFASSLLLGQFLSPSFWLSISGACLSLVVIAFGSQLPKQYFSAISLSILAATAHIAGQLLMVRLLIIPHANVVLLVPIFMLAALFFGLINGLITARLLQTQ